jgi:hypothetical protein
MPPTNPDLTLSTGEDVYFDLTQITEREYRSLFDPKTTNAVEDVIVARVAGISVDHLLDLNKIDSKKFYLAFLKKCREPLSNPN